MNGLLPVILVLLLALPGSAAADLFADNPLAHGAWLFKAHCSRCHGPYDRQRPAEEYDDEDELRAAVASDGCRVKWLRSAGGILSPREIDAVAGYMTAWEKRGAEPELPPLPELPAVEAPPAPAPPTGGAPPVVPSQPGQAQAALSPALTRLVESNPVARGAWLYTANCYRCHLSYASARMGRNMQPAQLRKIIEMGKTSTQMTGFSLLAGGRLKNSDIDAVTRYIAAWEQADAPLAIAPELLVPPAVDPSALRPTGLPRFPKVAGDPARGGTVFAALCSRCHGADRQGLVGRRLLPPWPGLRPDLLLKSTIKNGIPGSLMPSFGVRGILSPKQVDDLVTFLLGESEKPAVTQTIHNHNSLLTAK